MISFVLSGFSRRLDIVFSYHYRGTTFIYVMAIQSSKIYSISDKKSNK